MRAGRAPVVAPGAIAVQGDDGPELLVLDGEPAPIPLDAEHVVALASHGDAWVALAATLDGPAVIVVDRTGSRRVGVGTGELVRGALSVRGDRAVAAWTDASAALRAASIDLLRDRAGDPIEIAPSIDGAPLVAATQAGALVTWTARGASLVTITEGAQSRHDAPGLPLALLATPGGVEVLHTAPDRTGLWLTGAPTVRVTPPDAQPESPAAAELRGGAILAYRSGPDLFVQRLERGGVPRNAPIVMGGALGESPRTAPALAADGERVWIAWESAGGVGPEVHVRAGRCP